MLFELLHLLFALGGKFLLQAGADVGQGAGHAFLHPLVHRLRQQADQRFHVVALLPGRVQQLLHFAGALGAAGQLGLDFLADLVDQALELLAALGQELLALQGHLFLEQLAGGLQPRLHLLAQFLGGAQLGLGVGLGLAAARGFAVDFLANGLGLGPQPVFGVAPQALPVLRAVLLQVGSQPHQQVAQALPVGILKLGRDGPGLVLQHGFELLDLLLQGGLGHGRSRRRWRRRRFRGRRGWGRRGGFGLFGRGNRLGFDRRRRGFHCRRCDRLGLWRRGWRGFGFGRRSRLRSRWRPDGSRGAGLPPLTLPAQGGLRPILGRELQAPEVLCLL